MNELLGEWIATLPPQTFLLVPLLAFLESCLFVGLFVSGIFLLSTISLVYAQGDTSLFFLVLLSFMGALLGDHIGYFAGSRVAPLLWKKKWVRQQLVKRKVRYRKFRNMMIKSSPLAICVGRLSPPLRSLSPFLAGTSGLKPVQFFAYDLLACSIWAGGLAALAFGASQL